MLTYLKDLYQINGVSGNEEAVREYIRTAVEQCPGILETHTDALGNFMVLKQGVSRPKHTVMMGAHMDEVGLVVTSVNPDGTLSVAEVGGVNPDVVIGRYVRLENGFMGVVGATPVHKLSQKQRDTRPAMNELYVNFGAKDKADAERFVHPGDYLYFEGRFAELGGGRITAKAIDDRFGCAVMLKLLEGEIPYDTWFAFFVQEEVGLRGSRTAAYRINPEFAVILEATTAADLDGVTGGSCVCRLGGGPVVSFMDRSTIYDRELYRLAFAEAERLGIPCQTKTRVAGGNDAGIVHITREGIRTLAISVPCRYLHSPSCTAQISDMEQSLLLAKTMLEKIQSL